MVSEYESRWADIHKGVEEFDDSWGSDGFVADAEGEGCLADAAPAQRVHRHLTQKQRRAKRNNIKNNTYEFPAMPCVARRAHPHRPKLVPPLFPACVAEPVKRKDIPFIKEGTRFPAVEAMWKEATNLQKKNTWLLDTVRPWNKIAAEARARGETIHIGQVFGIMVIKNSELPVGDPKRKYKYRLVFSGDRAVTESWQRALFQDNGSNPASMESGKTIDAHGSLPGHVVQQADAEQAYIQADLQGPVTWVMLPEELWPAEWWIEHSDGTRTPKYDKPVVILKGPIWAP